MASRRPFACCTAPHRDPDHDGTRQHSDRGKAGQAEELRCVQAAQGQVRATTRTGRVLQVPRARTAVRPPHIKLLVHLRRPGSREAHLSRGMTTGACRTRARTRPSSGTASGSRPPSALAPFSLAVDSRFALTFSFEQRALWRPRALEVREREHSRQRRRTDHGHCRKQSSVDVDVCDARILRRLSTCSD